MGSNLTAVVLALATAGVCSAGEAPPVPAPPVRGARGLPESIQRLDRPLARVLILETSVMLQQRIEATSEPGTEAPGAEAAEAALREAVADLRAVQAGSPPPPEEGLGTEAWATLCKWATTPTGDARKRELGPARAAFVSLARARAEAAEPGVDPDEVLDAHRDLLWPLVFLHTRTGRGDERRLALDVLSGSVFFPPARRGSLTLVFPASFLAALGLAWVAEERYGDALRYLFEPERLPVVFPEAAGLAGSLRVLELERTLRAAAARRPSDAALREAPRRGDRASAVALVFADRIASSAGTAVRPLDPQEAARDAGSEKPSRRRRSGGFLAGLLIGVFALGLVVVTRTLRGQPTWFPTPDPRNARQ